MNTAALFEAARRATPLPILWQQLGLPLKGREGRFHSPYSPCCGTSNRDDACSLYVGRDGGTWRYHCFRCAKGGSSIDLIAALENLTPLEAAKRLVNDHGGITAITGIAPPERKPRVTPGRRVAALRRAIDVIKAINGVDPRVRRYLNEVRGFSDRVIDEAVHRGMLRTLPGIADSADTWLRLKLSEEDLKDSGLLAGRRPAAAYRPIAFLPPGNCVEFRTNQVTPNGPKALQYGDMEYPLVWRPTGKVTKILIVEGGFDVMAAVDLGFATNTLIVGALGTGKWRSQWVPQIHAKYPDAIWQIGSDVDKAGNGLFTSFNEALEKMPNLQLHVERLKPWGGSEGEEWDWNDTLLSAREAF